MNKFINLVSLNSLEKKISVSQITYKVGVQKPNKILCHALRIDQVEIKFAILTSDLGTSIFVAEKDREKAQKAIRK